MHAGSDDWRQVPVVLVVFARCRQCRGGRYARRSRCRHRCVGSRLALSPLFQTVRPSMMQCLWVLADVQRRMHACHATLCGAPQCRTVRHRSAMQRIRQRFRRECVDAVTYSVVWCRAVPPRDGVKEPLAIGGRSC